MNAFTPFPATLHWNAQQLADAVPPRLSELFSFDTTRDGGAPAANGEPRASRCITGYAPRPALHARFSVR